jgi:negative regulator of sigma E activity
MTDTTPMPHSEPIPGATPPDKFELHYRQQLSALIDGELPADEARFVLRRLQHDTELSGCHERWQLCGDILRGRVCAPAPVDFSERVRQAVAAEAQHADAARASAAAGGRRSWRWGGSAALAASVAAIALFMTRERLPDAAPAAPAVQVADSAAPSAPAPALPSAAAHAPTPVPTPAPADPQGDLGAAVAAAPAVAIAATRRQEAAARRGATRTQQAARGSAARGAEPVRAVAAATPPRPTLAPVQAAPVLAQQHPGDPFAHQPATPLQARPWPRSALAPAGSGGAFTASFPRQGAPAAFYPFEPRLPADTASAPAPQQP